MHPVVSLLVCTFSCILCVSYTQHPSSLLCAYALRCGSCDPRLSSLVAIHIRSLLPPGSADMDIPHHVEIASIASLGLLHMESANRHFADTMLKEIGTYVHTCILCIGVPLMQSVLFIALQVHIRRCAYVCTNHSKYVRMTL